ncbi:transcriptional activator NhaR [Agarilytica rhodophyticola]|uniref:transcriptional activator NhaR n=1 Tax=Agarilytica rhodophyticola TaxID=1737490 RepID=UPI000B343C25|nr:transcriptional activator NhaR [Agarilytica rhodophyticola]
MLKQINYNHLFYFYTVAKEGGIAKGAKRLNVTAQTVSGQIAVMESYLGIKLFDRTGKRLSLNETGHIVYSYAEDIFGLGNELASVLSSNQQGHEITFNVGIIDVIPKVFAFDLLKQCFNLEQSVRLVSREGDFDLLLADMALNHLDLIVSDRPLPPRVGVKAYSHYLGESGFTFFAEKKLAKKARKDFPHSLTDMNFLMPSDRSAQKNNLVTWFETEGIHPHVVAEFDDSALMKFFGQDGLGVFCTPTSIETFVLEQFAVEVVGRVENIKERYYGISPERKIKHPAVEKLFEEAKRVMN